MKLVGLFDNETGFLGDEMVMELVALLDSLTEFPESFVLGLLAMVETIAVTGSTGEIDVEFCCSTGTELLDDQLDNKEAAELETNVGDTHLTCYLDG